MFDALNEKPDRTGVTRLTVKLTVLVVAATALFASWTEKTILDVVNLALGVPVTAPVLGFRVRPDGSVPELTK